MKFLLLSFYAAAGLASAAPLRSAEGVASSPPLRLRLAAAAPSAPRTVTVGAYINDIQNLDIKSHSYSVDVYLWFRWKDPKLDPASSFEFINPYELWGHVRTPVYPQPVRLPNGELYQLVRNQGRFSRKLNLSKYPFDRQVLTVEIEDSNLTARDFAFTADLAPISANADLELPGFTIGTPRLAVVAHKYPSLFGDPRQPRDFTYSRVRIEVPVARPVLPYAMKLLLPMLCVSFCASLMFLFHPQYLDARVGIGITALLTIVALQITLNEDLPEVAYLVLMDKLYLAGYLFVIAGLAVVVRTTRMLELGRLAEAIQSNRRALVALTAFYFAAMAAFILLSL